MGKSNHDLRECNICEWDELGPGCEIYTNKKDVMLDEKGHCYSFCSDSERKKQIDTSCKNYFEHRTRG